MAQAKKLKDLKRGDRVYLKGFTGTTPITVASKKRTGMLVEITLKWDESEYTCYGHAFNTLFTGYFKKFRKDVVFSTDYDREHYEEQNRERNAKRALVGRYCKEFITHLKDMMQHEDSRH